MFFKESNILFILITISLLTVIANSTEISNSLLLSSFANSTINSLNGNTEDISLIQLFNSNKKNISEAKIFDELLEEVFNSEDNQDQNSWLSSEYKNILNDLNSQQEENYYKNLVKEKQIKDSFVYINEKESEEKLLNDFCSEEFQAFEEKMKHAENHVFNLEADERQVKIELDSLANKIKSNEESLKLKAEEINKQQSKLKKRQLNMLSKNSNSAFSSNNDNSDNHKNNHSEALLIIDSLISYVKNYYKSFEIENHGVDQVDKIHKTDEINVHYSNNDSKNKFASDLIQLISKAEKIKDYSLSIFLSEIASKHLNNE